MTGPPLSRALARAAVGLSLAEVPDDVVEIARQCVLDWLGVTLAGAGEEVSRIVTAELLDSGALAGRSGASVVGRDERLGIVDAALANGTASHALDYDDVNESMYGHPSVPILAGLLALGERRAASGADVICAFVAGYEAECRLARALGGEHYQRGFHATGTVGTFGAALACARLLGASAVEAEMAIGVAAAQASGIKSMFGTMGKPFHAGRAAAGGLLAARLAVRGFVAAPGAIETTQGFAETHSASFDPARAAAEPPGGWYLRNNLFKFHAACFQTHSAIEGFRWLRAQGGFGAADVVSATVHAEPAQMRMCAIEEPDTGLEVKFSLRHTGALALAGKDTAAIGTFSDETARDGDLVSLRRRIEVVVDRRGGGPTPVDVVLADGRTLSAAHDVSVPAADVGEQGRRLRQKFDALSTPVIGAAAAGALADLVDDLLGLGDVAELLAATRPGG
jgi:2-methylcitrate dehydratase PrpD